jgi:hypothetical protein
VIDWEKRCWPPRGADKDRLDGYLLRQQLFESDHRTAFAQRSYKMPPELKDKTYLVQDYPKLISTVFADLLYGESPIFTIKGAKQQAEVDSFVRDNKMQVTLFEGELSTSFRGDGFLRLRLDERMTTGMQDVILDEVPAHSCFVETDPDNCTHVLSMCIAWERQLGDDRFLRVEHHLPGKVINELYKIVGPKELERVSLTYLYGKDAPEAEIDTRVTMPLLFHVPNFRHGSSYWGQSDYTTGLIDLFDECNARFSAISEILDAHSDPTLIAPDGTLDRRGRARVQQTKVMEVSPEEAPLNIPRYLVWDGQLTAAFQMIEKCADNIFKFSEVSPAIFGEDKAGSIESGRAMLFRFMRTLAKVSRKRLYWDPIIMDIFHTAQLLRSKWLGRPAPTGPVDITWRHGLPKDIQELSNVASVQILAGIMSRHSAIRLVNQVGDQAAQAEEKLIDAERAAGQLPPMNTSSPGSMIGSVRNDSPPALKDK